VTGDTNIAAMRVQSQRGEKVLAKPERGISTHSMAGMRTHCASRNIATNKKLKIRK